MLHQPLVQLEAVVPTPGEAEVERGDRGDLLIVATGLLQKQMNLDSLRRKIGNLME